MFDEYERDNDGYMKQAESLYAFSNRCAGPEWEAVRCEMERWYAGFDDPNHELLGRFRKKRDEQHLPAWWELYVHRLLMRIDPVWVWRPPRRRWVMAPPVG